MENVCIEIENAEISFLDRVVLNIPRLAIHQFDRIGIVGKNGAGKSTLLKLIAGKIDPDKGHVKRMNNFAYFDQLSAPREGKIDYQFKGRLSIPENAIENLSGGEQTKLKLAQIFSDYHEGLLFDEPTTHLDTHGIQFFIDELTYYYGALVLVSHDRYVLDQLVTKVWEIEDGVVTEYTGSYTDYVQQKALERIQQLEQYESYVKEKNRLMKAAEEKMRKAAKITQANRRMSKRETKDIPNKSFMTKSKGSSQKSIQRAAKSMEQRVGQLEKVEAPKEEQFIRFHQSKALQLHNKFPMMADQLTLQVGDKLLLEDASFQFPLGKTIAITGPNGSGKTTLLRHIIQHGEGMEISPKVVIGAYEQMGYQFNKMESVFDYIKNRSDYHESTIRSALHSMGFIGSDITKNVQNLSGGEAIRLVLCQLFLGKYNVLILDEPTNFLDIHSIEALENFIRGYEGTILIVSHDQTFIEKVADCVYIIEDKQLRLKDRLIIRTH